MNKKLSIILLVALATSAHADLPRREVMPILRHNELITSWDGLPNHRTFFIGTTSSMEPVMSWWDTALVEVVQPHDSVAVGNVYIYHATWSANDVIHELVRISGHKLLFKGVNNRRYDPWVDRTAVRYVVRRVLATRQDTFAGGMNP